jgi:hypothetical protein
MRTSLIAFLAALGFSAAALAQDLPTFEELDQNGNDMIEPSEAEAVEGFDFAAADTNQDGAIDREEFSQLS